MQHGRPRLKGNRDLGTIQNNDINNILCGGCEGNMRPEDYREAVDHLLEGKPRVLAQTVGQPDPVIYRTREATTFDKYLVDVAMCVFNDVWGTRVGADPEEVRSSHASQAEHMARLLAEGTSPFEITIEACHAEAVPVLASYRMNGEDWYQHSYLLCEIGRFHPEYRIPRPGKDGGYTGVLDYAIPQVFEQRLRMFTEVASVYDVDGIEFDFRRWTNMISEPLKNYPVFNDLVRKTRDMLDATAREKHRDRMLLSVRVAPSLDDPEGTEYAGGNPRNDFSNRLLGLDVATWIERELVDVVCPSLFWPKLPGLPQIRDFVDLAQGRNVGVYPTVFPLPAWGEERPAGGRTMIEISDGEITELMRKHRDELCEAALRCYEEGADGVSTYNWFGHGLYSPVARKYGFPTQHYRSSQAYMRTELFVHAFLGSPAHIRRCLAAEPVVVDGECSWRS